MAISKITTRGFNFANTLSRGDFTDASFGDIVLLENEIGGLLMDASADGVDVEGHILYNNNESAEFFSNISTSQLSDDAVTAAKIADNTITADNINFALNEDNIILNATDGSSTDEGSFLLLDSSAASTDEGEKIIYDSIFNPATFNTTGNINNSLRDFSNLGLVKIFSGSAAAAATFELNSTYINERFDDYLIVGDVTPVTDAQVLRMRFLHNDIVHTGSDYYHELGVMSSSTYSSDNDAAAQMRMTYQTAGNAAGEGVSFHCTLTGVNRVNRPTLIGGQYNMLTDGGLSEGGVFNCGQDNGGRVFAVSGFQLYYASGNIVVNKIGVYGFAKD